MVPQLQDSSMSRRREGWDTSVSVMRSRRILILLVLARHLITDTSRRQTAETWVSLASGTKAVSHGPWGPCPLLPSSLRNGKMALLRGHFGVKACTATAGADATHTDCNWLPRLLAGTVICQIMVHWSNLNQAAVWISLP